MIKKLLCLLLILSTAFIIVACKKDEPDDQHDHTLVATEAVAATCTEDGTNAYWTCSGCNKVYADEAATTETTADAQKIAALGHDYAAATCTDPKTCKRDGCTATEGEALGHDYADATCTDPKTCKREGCDATEGLALGHNFAAATCTAPKTCTRDNCGATEGEALGHDFEGATVWGYKGADGHALKCNNCNEHDTVVAHTSSGPATEQAAEVCTVCNYEIAPQLNHTHSPAAEWSSDGSYHWHACTVNGCVAHLDEEAHTPATDDNDCTTATLCTVCNHVLVAAEANHTYDHDCDISCNNCAYVREAGDHKLGEEWKSDSTKHWKECENGCAGRFEETDHTCTPDNDCTTETKCPVCERVVTPAEDDHKYTADCDEMCDNEGCEHTRETNAGHGDNDDNGKCDSCFADYSENEGGTDVDGSLLTPPDEFGKN